MADAPTADAAQGRGPDKLLAIGAYGETVAAYRYLVLSEKAPNEEDRREFAEMADEEQGHKQRLQHLLSEMYPDADFVLTAEDKDLVVTGTRLLDVRDESSFHEAMRMILQTERKTAAFYAHHAKLVPQAHLRELFHELAEEGADHYQRLKTVARRAGVAHVPEDSTD
jgi:rubrerythrin